MKKGIKGGYFIVFEGIDGSGKTTVLNRCFDYLTSKGYSVIKLYEPTNGTFGKKIREISFKNRNDLDIEEELSLFVEDRKENIERNIKPALAQNKIILLDRYYYSTIAYQSASGIDKNHIYKLHRQFIIEPDLVLIFDLNPETSISRIMKNREGKANDFEKLDYLRKVRNNYLEFKNKNVYNINAHENIESVFQKSLEIINNRIKKEINNRRLS